MKKRTLRRIALLFVLLLGCTALALAEGNIQEKEITLPLNTRFYPKASFPEIADYTIASQPAGADVEHDWSWLRLEREGKYVLEGWNAEGERSLTLTIHAAKEVPALLAVTVAEEDAVEGLSFSIRSETPGSFTLAAEPACEVKVEDANGNVLGTNGAQLTVQDESVKIMLVAEVNGKEVRVPAAVSPAYPCVACGESPLTWDYNYENHVVGYCGHWLCLEVGDVHNNKCVCGDYLCNGEDHDGCIATCKGCGEGILNKYDHTRCVCGAYICESDYNEAEHAFCPGCGEIRICDPDYDIYEHYIHSCYRYICVGEHGDCALCGMCVCTVYSNPWTVTMRPEDHSRRAACGHMQCEVNRSLHYGDAGEHAMLECGRYACDGHNHAACMATPEPEITPEPELTPEPEITSKPELTPEPEITPEPEATPEPEVSADPAA